MDFLQNLIGPKMLQFPHCVLPSFSGDAVDMHSVGEKEISFVRSSNFEAELAFILAAAFSLKKAFSLPKLCKQERPHHLEKKTQKRLLLRTAFLTWTNRLVSGCKVFCVYLTSETLCNYDDSLWLR